jgi:hypothetical protein
MSLRDEILAMVRAEPGIQSTTLYKRIGVRRDTLGHSLQRLRRDGLIESTVRGRYIIAGSVPAMTVDQAQVKEKPVKLIGIEPCAPSTLVERAPAPPTCGRIKGMAHYSPSTFISPPSRDRLMSGR